MGKIIDFKNYKSRIAEQKAFGAWTRRFGEFYTLSSTLRDLSDPTLFALAEPGEDSNLAFYDLIMGALELGSASKFHYLDSDQKMKVVDIHLFLADQTRFEMVYRLGWIRHYSCQRYPLLQMIADFEHLKPECRQSPPELSESHPAQPEYQALIPKDKGTFIRRLLPQALEAFKKRLS